MTVAQKKQTALLLKKIDASRLSDLEISRLSGVTSTSISNWRSGRHQPSFNTQAMVLRILAKCGNQ